MEFDCLCLTSQIWVKQTQLAKYDAELSQLCVVTNTCNFDEALLETILQACPFSLAKMKLQNKNESLWVDRNICVVQLVLQSRGSPCSSAPWKRQMFTVAPGYRRCIGLAIWR